MSIENESKLVQARKLLLEGVVTGTGFAFGGFVAAAAFDMWKEWRTGKDFQVFEHSVAAKRGSANRRAKAPAIIGRFDTRVSKTRR